MHYLSEPIDKFGVLMVDVIPHLDLEHQRIARVAHFIVVARGAGQHRFHTAQYAGQALSFK